APELRFMHRDMRKDAARHFCRPDNAIEVFEICRARVAVMIPHDQLFCAIEPTQVTERMPPEQHITEVPHGIPLADYRVPAIYQRLVVLLNGGERAGGGLKLKNLGMAEVGIANEECFRHHFPSSIARPLAVIV